jgi:hypothetical protein
MHDVVDLRSDTLRWVTMCEKKTLRSAGWRPWPRSAWERTRDCSSRQAPRVIWYRCWRRPGRARGGVRRRRPHLQLRGGGRRHPRWRADAADQDRTRIPDARPGSARPGPPTTSTSRRPVSSASRTRTTATVAPAAPRKRSPRSPPSPMRAGCPCTWTAPASSMPRSRSRRRRAGGGVRGAQGQAPRDVPHVHPMRHPYRGGAEPCVDQSRWGLWPERPRRAFMSLTRPRTRGRARALRSQARRPRRCLRAAVKASRGPGENS